MPAPMIGGTGQVDVPCRDGWYRWLIPQFQQTFQLIIAMTDPWCWNIYQFTNICPKNHPVM
jgi:hypothetical protein